MWEEQKHAWDAAAVAEATRHIRGIGIDRTVKMLCFKRKILQFIMWSHGKRARCRKLFLLLFVIHKDIFWIRPKSITQQQRGHMWVWILVGIKVFRAPGERDQDGENDDNYNRDKKLNLNNVCIPEAEPNCNSNGYTLGIRAVHLLEGTRG